MKRYIFLMLLICTTGIAPKAFSAEESQDQKEIRAVFQSISDAFRARDPDGAMAPYVDDYMQFDIAPPLGAPGKAGNLKATKDYMNGTVGPLTVEFSDVHVEVFPGNTHAFAYSFIHLGANLKDGKVLDVNVRQSDVLKKIDGRWRIIHEHSSVPVNVATGIADLHAKKYGFGAEYFQDKKN